MSRWSVFGRWVVRFFLGLLLFAVGAGGLLWQLRTARHAGRARPGKEVVPVTVTIARSEDRTVIVSATGTVTPARRLELTPQVPGRIVERAPNFEPGGVFRKGDILLRLEPDDIQTAVTQAEARLAEAHAALRLEQGQQQIARREWKELPPDMTKGGADEDLVLRKPQLERAKAAVKSAESALSEARRNLERTVVRAPFNLTVLAKYVEIGQQVFPQTRLATLAGVDRWWAETAIPLEDLAWLQLPDANGAGGARARVMRYARGCPQLTRSGRVVRLIRQTGTPGRMARVLVEIIDPLQLAAANDPAPTEDNSLPLLLGDYVEIAITGRPIRNVIALPRPVVREGDKAWVVGKGGILQIRSLIAVRRTRDDIWVRAASPGQAAAGRGIVPGERVVSSDLPSAMPGLALRIVGPDRDKGSAPDSGTPPGAAEK